MDVLEYTGHFSLQGACALHSCLVVTGTEVWSTDGVSSCAERSPVLSATRLFPQSDKEALLLQELLAQTLTRVWMERGIIWCRRRDGVAAAELGTCAAGWHVLNDVSPSALRDVDAEPLHLSFAGVIRYKEPPAFCWKTLFASLDAHIFT